MTALFFLASKLQSENDKFSLSLLADHAELQSTG
jgi:hypothetical protein